MKTNGAGDKKEKVRKAQEFLNRFGFTDRFGKRLKEDGNAGAKTQAAMKKLNRYVRESRQPSTETLRRQREINEYGKRYEPGLRVKEDGVFGPETDAAENRITGKVSPQYVWTDTTRIPKLKIPGRCIRMRKGLYEAG